jgi:hypothetical protein
MFKKLLGITLLAFLAGCEDFCASAEDKADSCGVSGLEIEDDLVGCGEATAECRAACIEEASCEDIKASFAGGTDRTTDAWLCYEACGT